MPFNEIGNISIAGNDNEPGKAYGGFIYSSNVSIGNSSSPTTMTINVVHEKGVTEEIKTAIKKDIDELNLKKITIGDLDPIFMHLIKYEVRKNSGSSVLTLEYTDGSIILDKIFVGLVNRHASANRGLKDKQGNIKNEEHSIKEYKDGITSTEATIEMSVNCLKCDGSDDFEEKTAKSDGIYNSSGQKIKDSRNKDLPPIKRTIDHASPIDALSTSTNANYFFVPQSKDVFKKNGGVIILGRENFVENSCDVPDVDYTFHDLLESFKAGFISLKEKDGVPTLTDKTYENDYSPYRRDYSGTLREVLNSWCSDFGYTFTWNIYKESPEIVGINLTTSLDSLQKIKEKVNGIKSADAENAVVESTVESYSKEGTYKQSYVSQYIKGAKVKEKNQKKYAPKMFYNLPVELIMSPNEWNNRSLSRFVAHAALAKYSPTVRTSVLWGEKEYNTLGFFGVNGGSSLTQLSEEQRASILSEWNFSEVDEIRADYGDNFQMYLGLYNEDTQKHWEGLDAEIASGFIGRYYFRPVLNGELDEKGCITRAAFNHATQMVGGGNVQLYDWKSSHSCMSFPYAKFIRNVFTHQDRLGAILPYLRNSLGADNLKQDAYPPGFLKSDGAGNIDPAFQNESNIVNESFNYKNGIWIFEREAGWGTHEDAVRDQFEFLKGTSKVDHLRQTYKELAGRSLIIYQNLIKKTGGVAAEVNNGDSSQNYRPVLIIGPPPGRAMNCYTTLMSDHFTPKTYDDARLDKRYFDMVTANYNEVVSLSVQDAGSSATQAKATAQECLTICEENLTESICGTCNIDNEVNRPYVGFTKFAAYDQTPTGDIIPKGTISEYFNVYAPMRPDRAKTGARASARIILPSMQDYQGYLELNSNTRVTVEGSKNVFGSVLPIDNNSKSDKYENKTLAIKVVENNITNDVDEVVNPEAGQSIIDMLVPKNLKTLSGKASFKSIEPLDYHEEIKNYFTNQLDVSLPKEDFSFSLAGLNLKKAGLSEFILPEQGLTSMNINYGENGITTSLVFSTRPAVLPNPSIFMKRLGPKLNTFGR